MTKKLITLLAVILLSLLLTVPALAAKTYRAERFDVQFDLQPGGGLLVTDTVVFHFEGGPFTYAFREISANGTDGLTFLSASLDGVALPLGNNPGQVEVQPGDPLKVTWHFSPTSDQSRVFVVRYQVAGVVSTGAEDTLRWYVIPPAHEYPIEKITVNLNYVDGVRPLEVPVLDRAFDYSPTDTGIQLTAAGIPADESVILTARFPAQSLAARAPQWQAGEQQTAQNAARALPVGLLGGLASLMLGGAALFTYIRANARDLNLPAQTLVPSPPADLPPAVAGKLTGTANNALGVIFDLAWRGLLTVREENGAWGATDHILQRAPAAISLHSHEQTLLDVIFKPGENQVRLSEVGSRMASQSARFDQLLDDELLWRGWLDPQRKQTRAWLVAAGMLTLLGGASLFLVGAIITGALLGGNATITPWTALLAGLGGGMFVLSIPMLIYAATYSTLTLAGEEQKLRWVGFRTYLDQVCRGREAPIRVDMFERYLAFAAVFGLGAAWARHFQKLGGVPLPVWFQALPGSDGDFGAMVAVMTASDSATYAGGADGGGGASGGGSSGAG